MFFSKNRWVESIMLAIVIAIWSFIFGVAGITLTGVPILGIIFGVIVFFAFAYTTIWPLWVVDEQAE